MNQAKTITRIGILTLPLHNNYGGILQAYALQTILEKRGYNVRIINKNYEPVFNLPLWKRPLVYSKRFILNLLKKSYIPIFYEQQKKQEYPIVSYNMRNFVEQNIHVYTVDNLLDVRIEDFDAIVVGSDQIWRPKYVRKLWGNDIRDAYLKFAEHSDVKRISYAASFGVDKWEYTEQETCDCSKYLKLFDAISVRETSGVRMCSDYFDISADFVLDPTMLLESSDYIRLFDNKSIPQSEGILLYYILDETVEKLDLVGKIAKERNLKLFCVNGSKDYHAPVEERVLPSIETWLKGFNDAQFVVTDSFHGCVFSLLFGKPFVAIGNVKRGMSRFSSLFSLFSLDNHMIYSPGEYDSSCSYAVNDSFFEQLNEERRKSINFLFDNLQ